MKISNNIYAESEMAIRSPIEKSAKFSIVHSFRSSACGYLFLLYFFTFSVFVLRHLFIVYFLFSVPIHILCSTSVTIFSLSFIALCFWNKCCIQNGMHNRSEHLVQKQQQQQQYYRFRFSVMIDMIVVMITMIICGQANDTNRSQIVENLQKFQFCLMRQLSQSFSFSSSNFHSFCLAHATLRYATPYHESFHIFCDFLALRKYFPQYKHLFQ